MKKTKINHEFQFIASTSIIHIVFNAAVLIQYVRKVEIF